MLFNTPQFILTTIWGLICWYISPNKIKKVLLLIYSYFFAYLLGGVATVLILISVTLLAFIAGIIISKAENRKTVCSIFVILFVSLLVYCKYTNYFINLLGKFSGKELSVSVLTAIGISYYTFSAISYVVDVYKNKDSVDTNILDVALWLAYFLKIIAGPIERHNEFKKQLEGIKDFKFNAEILKRGLLICSLGYFYKIIISDRIGFFVDGVYSNLDTCTGLTLVIAMIMYSLQIYFDFAGYSMIAYGFSYAIGIKISKNFDHPYFSSSVAEFWRRWHISLSRWLKDYVYIPLGGNRKGIIRQYINIMITFLISGIWHGAGLSFIIWGGLHGIFQIVEKVSSLNKRLSKSINCILTFIAVSFAWIFFRAESTKQALMFIKNMFIWNPDILKDSTLVSMGVDALDWMVLAISLGIACIIGVTQTKNISLYNVLKRQNIIIRWCGYYLIIILLIIFGKYGATYDASNFIYFKF